eukprot:10553945-Heterocapsa_arctica.AAC.1
MEASPSRVPTGTGARSMPSCTSSAGCQRVTSTPRKGGPTSLSTPTTRGKYTRSRSRPERCSWRST